MFLWVVHWRCFERDELFLFGRIRSLCISFSKLRFVDVAAVASTDASTFGHVHAASSFAHSRAANDQSHTDHFCWKQQPRLRCCCCCCQHGTSHGSGNDLGGATSGASPPWSPAGLARTAVRFSALVPRSRYWSLSTFVAGSIVKRFVFKLDGRLCCSTEAATLWSVASFHVFIT